MIEDWVAELCTALDVPRDAVDVNALLELARDAAHNVDRPAAPVTTYIVGLAAGRADGDVATIRELTERAGELARQRGAAAPS